MTVAQGFRDIAATSALMARQRVELAALDVEDEILQAGRLFATALAVAVLGSLALASAAAAIVIIFWDTARVAAVFAVTCAFAIAAAWVWFAMRRAWDARPAFLAATIEQLQRDADRIGGRA